MECTNFWELEKKLYNQALNELKAAAKAHGGRYVFIATDENDYDTNAPHVDELDYLSDSDAPNVQCIIPYSGDLFFLYVTQVEIVGEEVRVYGIRDNGYGDGSLDEVCAEVCSASDIQTIIESIPETEEAINVIQKH